jgi:hypothetical protein
VTRLPLRSAAVAALGAAVLATAPALAHSTPAPRIRLTGISVNQQNFTPGTKVTLKAPVNACYGIGGPTQDPPSVQVFFFLHAVSIPKSASMTVSITTPWDQETFPSTQAPAATFSKLWFTDRGHGASSIFGGPQGKYDYYRYDDEGTGSNIFDGKYTIALTVKVHRHTLHAHGSITVAC